MLYTSAMAETKKINEGFVLLFWDELEGRGGGVGWGGTSTKHSESVKLL